MEVIAQSEPRLEQICSETWKLGEGTIDKLSMSLHIDLVRLAQAVYTWKTPSQSALDDLTWMLPGAI